MKRRLGPLLLAVLVIGVGTAIYVSASGQLAARRVVTVRGLIGSEKEDFFRDSRVVEELRRNGIVVEIEKAGSRQIATNYDLSQYDFAFPSGVPAAERIRQTQAVSVVYSPFFTPMAVASWQPIATLLESAGLVQDAGGYYTLDLNAYIGLVQAGTRWSDLEDNAEYPVAKSVLISSTDVRKSNSAAMYLALASYAANGNDIVQNETDIRRVLPIVEPLFLKQGYTEYSSEVPFDDYLVMGIGKAPMVMIYEAQFVAEAAAEQSGIRADMVLMYPQPTIFTKHIFLPFTDSGAKLGELLQDDPELQRLAIEHGFRNDDLAYFRQFTTDHGIALPDTLVNVIEPPSYEVLERMIQEIEQDYQ